MSKRTFITQVRVRYAETDRMGYCYYGNFAAFFEVGRVEALRSLGFSYRKLEDEGIILPVLDYSVRYFKPAYYDEVLTIETSITEVKGARILFEYTTKNEQGEELNKAKTTLVFVDAKSGRPTKAPETMAKVLNDSTNN